MRDKIKEICNKLNREQLSVHGATEELLNLSEKHRSKMQPKELLIAYSNFLHTHYENAEYDESDVDEFLKSNL